jgi:hypothetical protein
MERKKPAPSLDFLKAQAIGFVGLEIWRFSHLHKSRNFLTLMVIFLIKLKKIVLKIVKTQGNYLLIS